MNNFLNNVLKYISYDERRKKNLEDVTKKSKQYMKMTKYEFIMEYTNIVAKFEHKRTMFSLVIVTIFLTMVTGCWKYFFDIFNALIVTNSALFSGYREQAIIFVILVFILILIVLIFSLMKMAFNLNRLNKEKILIEQVEKIRIKGNIK